ncbi:MAG: superoxide dismutase [Ni] [Candidatus Latescibacterota bacterium]|nr:superoxide dismutase [Ni] [Candidatus Latescibacterota bacterium]MEC8646843.1 superoxide dismutase [Ni] [Candidatus Latescibacterota bacterium]MEE2725770.1 superoxide dismutase [Ni] [Candidatus Latescibacterota bacterium]
MFRYAITLALAATCMHSSDLYAHCEVPCGIYGDDARFSAIAEDAQTIEKAMGMIADLAGKDDAQSANQLARWVVTKEEHANKIQHVVTQYFMTQRLKAPGDDDAAAFAAYTEKLVLLHKMLRTAMLCKQSVDTTHPQALHDLLHEFQAAYSK